MKILAIDLVFVMLPFALHSELTDRESSVVGCLEQLVCGVEDNFDDSNMTQEVTWVSWTQDGFFGKMATQPSERALYRGAFESVLERFATNVWTESGLEIGEVDGRDLARVALSQVRDMSYTNALPIVRAWAMNNSAPHRDQALGLYYRWTCLNDDSLLVSCSVLTNMSGISRGARIETVCGLSSKIADHVVRVGMDNCYTNAVCLLYRTRYANVACAKDLDDFFVAQIPGYSSSSNRLETARGWISVTGCTSDVRRHCAGITNRLMNATQPLLEVEALRGL